MTIQHPTNNPPTPLFLYTRRHALEGMVKVKLFTSAKEPEMYHYFNGKGEKLWMFRHKYYDSSGKRKEKKKSGFKTEKTALKALLEVKAATLRGESKRIDHDNLTVGEWLDIWYEMNKSKWKVTSCKQREMVIRVHMKPLLGRYKLQKLDRITYQREYINKLEKKHKPNTVRLFHNLFKIAINGAVEEEILPRNRFTKVTFSAPDHDDKKQENFLTPSELVTFLDTAKQYENITNYSFLLTVAYTGVRRGEACGIQWKNVDFENNTITIERTRDDNGIRPPKTKNSYRTILVDPFLMNQLKTYRKWCMEIMLSVGYKFTGDSFVFTNHQTGEPIKDNSVWYAFSKTLKKANLPKITLHGLRHTHCTILLNQGLNVQVIAGRLGNTPQMIYEVYGHILKELEQQSVTLFSQSLKASGAKSGANF